MTRSRKRTFDIKPAIFTGKSYIHCFSNNGSLVSCKSMRIATEYVLYVLIIRASIILLIIHSRFFFFFFHVNGNRLCIRYDRTSFSESDYYTVVKKTRVVLTKSSPSRVFYFFFISKYTCVPTLCIHPFFALHAQYFPVRI